MDRTLCVVDQTSEVQLLNLIALQIVTFMVLAIIGCMFAAIQLILAASGASAVHFHYGSYISSSCFVPVCNEASRFMHVKSPAGA